MRDERVIDEGDRERHGIPMRSRRKEKNRGGRKGSGHGQRVEVHAPSLLPRFNLNLNLSQLIRHYSTY